MWTEGVIDAMNSVDEAGQRLRHYQEKVSASVNAVLVGAENYMVTLPELQDSIMRLLELDLRLSLLIATQRAKELMEKEARKGFEYEQRQTSDPMP